MGRIREQFHWANFGLKYQTLPEFYLPLSSKVHPYVLIVIRGIFTCYTIGAMIADLIDFTNVHRNAKWFTFFTTWNYIINVMYFIVSFIRSIKFVRQCIKSNNRNQTLSMQSIYSRNSDADYTDHTNRNNLRIVDKFYWILFNLTVPVCSLVVIGFWTVLFDPEEDPLRFDKDTYFTVDRHGIILVLILVDYFMHAIPYRILHFIYPVGFFAVYFIFHAIYSITSGDTVYGQLDWEDKTLSTFLKALGVTVAAGVFHFIYFWIDALKKTCGRNCCNGIVP